MEISAVTKINNFLSINSWVTINRRTVKAKVGKPFSVKWLFKSKEYPDISIIFKSMSLLEGYIQVPGVAYTESFSPVTTETSALIIIGLTLYVHYKVKN